MRQTYIKNGETLALDPARCTGCGICVDVCPHEVFALEEGRARILHRGSCMECGACAKNCPAGALAVKAGVGCASAIILGKLRGTEPSCGEGGASCCGEEAAGRRPRSCC